MQTEFCRRLGIEYPIFAFSHCRDVVAAVSKAGGMGVFGMNAFTDPAEVKAELDWLDAHVGDKRYGIDVVIPQKYEGKGAAVQDIAELERMLEQMIPAEHRAFRDRILAENGVPELPADAERMGLLGWTETSAAPALEEALKRDKCALVANALGTPPADVIRRIQASGRLVGALCGKVKQAKAHQAAGLDFIVAQGSEGGGHTGEVGSIVIWPQIIDAVRPLPVLCAGGIADGRQMLAALGMGAAGVWSGSLWLTAAEAAAQPAEKALYFSAGSEDTVRSRSWTGKGARMLRNAWTEAWEQPDAPKPLGMPLQGLLTMEAMQRTGRYIEHPGAQRCSFSPVGQVVGMLQQESSCRDIVARLVNEYLDALDGLQKLMPGA
jgi:NAD(P)H-dependent flavin oxidoreductase YrpB (nitropropane dioxygenase family)